MDNSYGRSRREKGEGRGLGVGGEKKGKAGD